VLVALHAGEAITDARSDYRSAPLNRLSRLLSTGHSGQILLLTPLVARPRVLS
jgi:hypothetical protein